MDRLDKILSSAGICSRRGVRELVRSRRVIVDGSFASSPDMKVASEAVILVDGEKIERMHPVTAVMNKPSGYVTSTDDPRDRTVMELLPPRFVRLGLYPVGRLDKDTAGLLIFTNDGTLAHELISPKRNVEKEYLVTHKGTVTEEIIRAFQDGLVLPDGTKCRSAVLSPEGDGRSLVTITEGKYHQVRRMMAARGLDVIALERVREGGLTLSGLERGDVRELSREEVASLLD